MSAALAQPTSHQWNTSSPKLPCLPRSFPWATPVPNAPGALTSSDAPQHWGLLCPSAAPQDLWMMHQDQPLCCPEGLGGLPLLWEQCTVLLELVLPLPEAP